MAAITPDTFDPLRRYVSVRLQQGVPIVDADWNESEDVWCFELRAFLKWFAGDGVPEGNDGFRIEGLGLDNDFVIRSGASGQPDGLQNVGRCLVDGLDVVIDQDLRFSAQPLHASQPDAAALAAALKVPVIQALITPIGDINLAVYLDMWERLVTPSEDPSLIHPSLGVESTGRLKREWAVRTRPGTSAPVAGDTDDLDGHSYYVLAILARHNGAASVNSVDITDQREQRLLLSPSTLITDVFGTSPTEYRRGQDRPLTSFRDAINALLHGEFPGSADALLADISIDIESIGATFLDHQNGVVSVWASDLPGNDIEVFATRLDLDNVSAETPPPLRQITADPQSSHLYPHAALLPNNDLIVVYAKAIDRESYIFLKRGPLDILNAVPEQEVTATPGVREHRPHVVITGDLAIVIYHESATDTLRYRRYRHTDDTWVDNTTRELSPQGVRSDIAEAVSVGPDYVHLVFVSETETFDLTYHIQQWAPSTGVVSKQLDVTVTTPNNDSPISLLPTSGGDTLLFYPDTGGLYVARFSDGQRERITHTTGEDVAPYAVEDVDGGIWLFWTRGLEEGTHEGSFAMRLNPITGLWGQPRQFTASAGFDAFPLVLRAPDQSFWVFWVSDRQGGVHRIYKRLILTL